MIDSLDKVYDAYQVWTSGDRITVTKGSGCTSNSTSYITPRKIQTTSYRNYNTTSKTAYCSNMKFFIFVSAIVLTFLAIFGVAADQPMKQIIISYPKGTPASVLEEAKKYVLDAGGFIS